jgi:hypothetical protein
MITQMYTIFIFINEKYFDNSKKNNYDYAETGSKEFL